MAQITFDVPARHLPAFLRVHPNNETMDDPTWVDPGDGSTAPQVPKYTDGQWVKEWGIRLYRIQAKRGYDLLYKDAQADSSTDDIT